MGSGRIRRATVLLVVAGLMSAGCGRSDGGEEFTGQRAPSEPIPGAPVAAAVDEAGARWVAVDQGEGWPLAVRSWSGDATSDVELASGRQTDRFGVALVAHAGGVLVAHLVCDDAPCNHPTLQVDRLAWTDGDVRRGDSWTVDIPSDAGAPRLLGTTDESVGLAVGGAAVVIGPDGPGEVVGPPERSDVGDICLVDGRVIGLGSASPPPPDDQRSGEETNPTLIEEPSTQQEVVVVDVAGGAVVDGSSLVYDPTALVAGCSGGHLGVGAEGQPATFTWDGAAWTEVSPQSVDWQLTPRPDGVGPVGVTEGQVVRLDPVDGSVTASAPVPPGLAERLAAGPQPLGSADPGPVTDLVAIGFGEDPAVITCHGTVTEERSEVRCE